MDWFFAKQESKSLLAERVLLEIEDLADFQQSLLEGRIRDILDRLSMVDGQAGQFRGALA